MGLEGRRKGRGVCGRTRACNSLLSLLVGISEAVGKKKKKKRKRKALKV